MTVLAIDPGDTQSALVIVNDRFNTIEHHEKSPNEEILEICRRQRHDIFAVEILEDRGFGGSKPIRVQHLYDTQLWAGRFFEASCGIYKYGVFRRDVKRTFCASFKAGDKEVRAAMLGFYGNPGSKRNPGNTYGITADQWSALAIASFVIKEKPWRSNVKTNGFKIIRGV